MNLFQEVVGASQSRVCSALGAALLALLLLAVGIACSSPSAPADTPTPVPPDTPTSVPANTPTPVPADTATPVPTATPIPVPSEPFRLGLLNIGVLDFLVNSVPLEYADGEQIEDSGPTYKSALLAIQHVNDAGGVWGKPVEHSFADSLPVAVDEDKLYQQLVGEGAHGIVGATSPGLADIGKIIKDVRAPIVASFSQAPSVAHIDDDGFIFRTSINDLAQAYALAGLAANDGYDYVAVGYTEDNWGREMVEAFTNHFDGRVNAVGLPLNPPQSGERQEASDSYDAHLRQLAEDDAPALVILTYRVVADQIMEEVAKNNHFEEFLLHSQLRTLDFYQTHSDVLENAKGVSSYGLHITEAEGHWEADYMEEFGLDEPPHSPFVRETYDAAVALMLAAEHAKSTDGEAIRDSLHVISSPPGKRFSASAQGIKDALQAIRNGEEIDLDGEASTLDWDQRGELISHTMGVWQFENGAIEDLYHFEVTLDHEGGSASGE